MTRLEILAEIKKYFAIKELVCDHVVAKWGDNAWQFLSTDYLHALLVIRRDILKKGMVCNTSALFQRGLRCNICPMVKSKTTSYLSSHILGQAGDFTVSGMTGEQARELIKKNADLLPCNIRMERLMNGVQISWLHIDTLNQVGKENIKVYEFDV